MPSLIPLPDGEAADQTAHDGLQELLRNLNYRDDNRFLEIGRQLRAFCDALPPGKKKFQALDELLKDVNVQRRRAIYWIEIDRIYSCFGVPRERLARIGWTKLSIMAKHIDGENAEDWLAFAERSTTHELRARVRKSVPTRHQIVFKLTAAQNAILIAALTSGGARRKSSRSLANKEAALMELCRRSIGMPADEASSVNDTTPKTEPNGDACWHPTQ